MKKRYNIKGMHCKSCEILLEKSISQVQGVRKVEVSQKKGIADVEFANGAADDEGVLRAVRAAGYSLGVAGKLRWLSRDQDTWLHIVLGAAVLLVLWMFAALSGLFDRLGGSFSAAPTYPIVFVIGLTAGISTCMAMVGGLVAGFSASYAEKHEFATPWQRFKPNLFFVAGRTISYAALGGAIGALGSAVKLSTGFTGFLILLAGFVMLYMGLKLTDISPKLSNMNFTLPKKFGQIFGAQGQGGDYSHKEAFIGGAFTFFLPCGFTQAMQLYAITTGSFVSGAIIMGLFALGTMPGLLGVGAVTSLLKGQKARLLFRFIGLVVVILGVVNVANGASLSGLNIPLPSFGSPAAPGQAGALAPVEGGVQVVNMTQAANGYSPNYFTVKKGIPVKWVIDSQNAFTCAASIRMPAYNIAQFLQAGQNIITFTPTQAGTVPFTCGMGMYRGVFNVVE
ncbi:MAG: sulfite exporter TauE/SafE family protein [Patescibacteria group bacterium]|nr:sulfite exporter TauE/SafE family protein [Patescibacteria group bacterium]